MTRRGSANKTSTRYWCVDCDAWVNVPHMAEACPRCGNAELEEQDDVVRCMVDDSDFSGVYDGIGGVISDADPGL